MKNRQTLKRGWLKVFEVRDHILFYLTALPQRDLSPGPSAFMKRNLTEINMSRWEMNVIQGDVYYQWYTGETAIGCVSRTCNLESPESETLSQTIVCSTTHSSTVNLTYLFLKVLTTFTSLFPMSWEFKLRVHIRLLDVHFSCHVLIQIVIL